MADTLTPPIKFDRPVYVLDKAKAGLSPSGASFHTGRKVFRHPGRLVKNESVYYAIGLIPYARFNSAEYLLNDLVIPATANGFMYVWL